MGNTEPVNHHYVPQFLLRNFSEDDHMIYMYRFNEKKIVKRNLKYNFSKDNLYKDVSEEDVMLVEKLFSELERKVSDIIKRITEAKNQVELNRIEVEAVKRFFYLMEFRSKRRKWQYENQYFDPLTEAVLDEKAQNKDYVGLWLNELKLLLQHTKYDINLDELSLPIRMDFQYYMDLTFIVIWDACQDERFVITDNYGTFERSREMSPLKLFLLFPVSPRRMIVLADKLFENPKHFSDFDSEFSEDIIRFPKNNRVAWPSENPLDKYVYNVQRVKNPDVVHANELLINETYEFFAFLNSESVERSVERYQSRPKGYTKKEVVNFFGS